MAKYRIKRIKSFRHNIEVLTQVCIGDELPVSVLLEIFFDEVKQVSHERLATEVNINLNLVVRIAKNPVLNQRHLDPIFDEYFLKG